jgi:hypothetical protein
MWLKLNRTKKKYFSSSGFYPLLSVWNVRLRPPPALLCIVLKLDLLFPLFYSYMLLSVCLSVLCFICTFFCLSVCLSVCLSFILLVHFENPFSISIKVKCSFALHISSCYKTNEIVKIIDWNIIDIERRRNRQTDRQTKECTMKTKETLYSGLRVMESLRDLDNLIPITEWCH